MTSIYFSPRELAVRVRTVLRRSAHASLATERLQLGNLVIDARLREVTIGGATPRLTAKEFDLLFFLGDSHLLLRERKSAPVGALLVAAHSQTTLTLRACGPFGPSSVSNSTFAPSGSDVNPSPETALK